MTLGLIADAAFAESRNLTNVASFDRYTVL